MQRTGSSKIITPVEPGVVAFRFTDRWSAFDRGSSPQTIPGIGAARCICAVRSFTLAHAVNAPTHFLEQVDDVTIHVQEFGVPGQEPLSGMSHGRVLPLEWIERTLAAGSLLERLKEGTDPSTFGFPKDAVVTLGTPLPRPVHECTTKFEKSDRHLTDADAKALADLNDEQWQEAWNLVIAAANITSAAYGLAGFVRPDGKKELGITKRGRLVLVDVFGTQDEDRIVEGRTGKSYCKDLIRDYLKGLLWYQELRAAKKEHPGDKSKWPPYPELPAELVDTVSTRYAEAGRRYDNIHTF